MAIFKRKNDPTVSIMNDLLYKIRVQMKRNDISEDEMQYLSSNYEVLINFEKNYQKGNTNLTNYTTH